MKKIMMLILGVLLFIPAIVLADMGAPGVREYKVTPKSEEGAGIYRITYEGDKATVEKAGTVPYGKEISIMQEFEIDGILYGDYYDSNYDVHHIKLSEFKAVGENTEKDEAIYAARVFAENGLELYEGPGSAYEKTGKTVAKGTLVAASEYIGYGTWVYIESGDIKGYVNAEKGGLGVLYRRPIMNTETNKEYIEYYDLDDWSRAYMVEDNGTYKKINSIFGAAYKFYYENSIAVVKDWKLQKTGDFNSETIAEVHKGDKVTILYDASYQGRFMYYVTYNDQKGWLNYDWVDENSVSVLKIDYENLKKTDDYMEYGEGRVLYDTLIEEQEAATKKSSSSKATNPNTILIGSIVAGGAIVLASIVTIILVNKNKKKTNEE